MRFSATRFPRRTCLLLWSGLYFGIKHFEALQQQREAALKASALAQEAQVKMLRYQLNPHFLFNTLNAISTLILDGQSKVANLAVTRLSDFLRYTLDKDPMKRVSLRQEIDALNLYLGHREAAVRRPAQAQLRHRGRGLPGPGSVADPAAADRERTEVRGRAA